MVAPALAKYNSVRLPLRVTRFDESALGQRKKPGRNRARRRSGEKRRRGELQLTKPAELVWLAAILETFSESWIRRALKSFMAKRPSPMAPRVALERDSTIARYFSATGRSAGWISIHQRRMDSRTSLSVFEPSTMASRSEEHTSELQSP